MDKILLFIPAYNCESQIVRVLGQLDNDVLKYITEIIVINNRSTDNTEQVVLDYINTHNHLPIKLLRNNENYGLGGSHKVAFQYAISNKYDYVIVLHGDDQANISDLLSLLKSGEYRKHDSILGARFMKGSKIIGYSWFRTFGNYVYDIIFSIFCGFSVKDLGSGLNMYKVSKLIDKYYLKYPDNLIFNYCMVMAIQYYRQDVKFFPITWREEDQISNVKLFNQAYKVLALLFSYVRNRSKFMQSEIRTKIIANYDAEIIKQHLEF